MINLLDVFICVIVDIMGVVINCFLIRLENVFKVFLVIYEILVNIVFYYFSCIMFFIKMRKFFFMIIINLLEWIYCICNF